MLDEALPPNRPEIGRPNITVPNSGAPGKLNASLVGPITTTDDDNNLTANKLVGSQPTPQPEGETSRVQRRTRLVFNC